MARFSRPAYAGEGADDRTGMEHDMPHLSKDGFALCLLRIMLALNLVVGAYALKLAFRAARSFFRF